MTRLWPHGEPIEVVLNQQAQPARLIWQGQAHAIQRIVQAWEVDTDWWEASGRLWYAYYAAVTQAGLLCVFYQVLPDGQWYLSKLYD